MPGFSPSSHEYSRPRLDTSKPVLRRTEYIPMHMTLDVGTRITLLVKSNTIRKYNQVPYTKGDCY